MGEQEFLDSALPGVERPDDDVRATLRDRIVLEPALVDSEHDRDVGLGIEAPRQNVAPHAALRDHGDPDPTLERERRHPLSVSNRRPGVNGSSGSTLASEGARTSRPTVFEEV
jgi:hypothetical protein